jgi:hypothetical protein
LGVLSGSLVIVPATALACVRDAVQWLGIGQDDLVLSEAPHDSAYLILSLRGEYHLGSVRLITSVFESGAITVLVGTKALLGEGWDAPSINTLVLASFVGSYVPFASTPGNPRRPPTSGTWSVLSRALSAPVTITNCS